MEKSVLPKKWFDRALIIENEGAIMSGDHNMYASGSGDGQRSGWRKRQTIEHMWKVASGNPHHDTNWHDPVVIAFAALVREDEREACAEICDRFQARDVGMQPAECAGAIRARGQA